MRKQRYKEHRSNLAVGSESIPSNRKRVRNVITERGDISDPPYIVRLLNRDCLRQKAVVIKSSTRWIDTYKTPNGGLGVPFIDKLGFYTGHLVYKWSCDPRSLITTVVSTITKRIVDYAHRHNKKSVVRKYKKPLFQAAAYYAFTKNSYFWDRILYFSRNLEKNGMLIHRLRLFFSSKWDDNKRFVYSQVIFQTNWLLFRASRPRDKSLFFRDRKKATWSDPSCSPCRDVLTNQVREIAYAISMI